MFCRTGKNLYIMARDSEEGTQYRSMFLLSFPLLAPHHLVEAEKFNIRFPNPSEITETADKLRWYRYRKALLQREVAEYAGIDRSTYIHYEEYGRDYNPLDKMEKIAEVLGVPVTELLDEYNLFLYNNQGRQIREMRRALGMTGSEYAARLGVPLGTLKNWERKRVRILKSTWGKLFRK